MGRTVIDIVVTWGASTLHVSRRTTPCRFSIGEDARADCLSPREVLDGEACVDLLVPHRGGVALVLPNGAAGDDAVDLIEQHAATQGAQPYRDVSGRARFAIEAGTHVRVRVGELIVDITASAAERARRPATRMDRRSTAILALSLAAHAGLIIAAAYTLPCSTPAANEVVERDALLLGPIITLDAPAEDEDWDDEDCRCRLDVGRRGTPESRFREMRYAVSGPADNPDPHLSWAHPPIDGESSSLAPIGSVVPLTGDTRAFVVEWGRDDVLGNDPGSARGRMWGEHVGHVFGVGALVTLPRPIEPDPEEQAEEEQEEEEDRGWGTTVIRTIGRGTGAVLADFHHGHGRVVELEDAIFD